MLKLGPRRSKPNITFLPIPRQQEASAPKAAQAIQPELVDALLAASRNLDQILQQRGMQLTKESHREVVQLLVRRLLRTERPPTPEEAAQTLSLWILREMEHKDTGKTEACI